jgi:hypothetical protein
MGAGNGLVQLFAMDTPCCESSVARRWPTEWLTLTGLVASRGISMFFINAITGGAVGPIIYFLAPNKTI